MKFRCQPCVLELRCADPHFLIYMLFVCPLLLFFPVYSLLHLLPSLPHPVHLLTSILSRSARLHAFLPSSLFPCSLLSLLSSSVTILTTPPPLSYRVVVFFKISKARNDLDANNLLPTKKSK